MKHQLTFLLIFLVSNLLGQYEDKMGYFIDNEGQMTKCLIYDKQWRINPTEILYRIHPEDELRKKLVIDIKEFGIDADVTYVRYSVDYDVSDISYYNASSQKAPIFEKKLLLLKKLVSGNVDLLVHNGSKKSFFFKENDAEVKQLIYKTYRDEKGSVLYNNGYRQQLKNIAVKNNSKYTSSNFKRIRYDEKSLRNWFTKLNKEITPEFSDIAPTFKGHLNLFGKAGIKYLTATTPKDNFSSYAGGIGVEYTLPYGKKRNSFISELEFSRFSDSDYNTSLMFISFGPRFRRFFSSKSSLFLGINARFDIHIHSDDSKSMIIFDRDKNGALLSFFELSSGYKYKNFFIEVKLDTVFRGLYAGYYFM